LGIGQSPIPNPQSPFQIPNSTFKVMANNKITKKKSH